MAYETIHARTADEWIVSEHTSGYRSPVNDRMNAILIREYGNAARNAILYKRREALRDATLTQRKWQATAKRQSHGNHWDTWGTREMYVRGASKHFKRPDGLRTSRADRFSDFESTRAERIATGQY